MEHPGVVARLVPADLGFLVDHGDWRDRRRPGRGPWPGRRSRRPRPPPARNRRSGSWAVHCRGTATTRGPVRHIPRPTVPSYRGRGGRGSVSGALVVVCRPSECTRSPRVSSVSADSRSCAGNGRHSRPFGAPVALNPGGCWRTDGMPECAGAAAEEVTLVLVERLKNVDAFVVFDLEDAPCSAGVVRSAPKILLDGATWLARSATYQFASFEIRAGGASAGVNAAPDARPEAVAAFVAEVQPWVDVPPFRARCRQGDRADRPRSVACRRPASRRLLGRGDGPGPRGHHGRGRPGRRSVSTVARSRSKVSTPAAWRSRLMSRRGADGSLRSARPPAPRSTKAASTRRVLAEAWQNHGPDLVRELVSEAGTAR